MVKDSRGIKTNQRNSTGSPSALKTPGKKLFKRLFCSTSKPEQPKGSALFDQSMDGIYSSSGPAYQSPSPHTLTTKTTDPSITSATSGELTGPVDVDAVVVPSPEMKSRNLLNDISGSMVNDPYNSSLGVEVSDVLPHDHVLFNTSPYSENSSPNMTPTTPPDQATTASRGMTMKTPGMAIPTPQTKPARGKTSSPGGYMFPHPLLTVKEGSSSPSQGVEVTHISLSQSVSEQLDDEEDAFLPDDFVREDKTYTLKEVMKMIEESETQVREHMEDLHQRTLEEYQEEVEQQFKEHGAQWKEDSEVEYERLDSLLRAERSKTSKKHHELLEKTEKLEELESRLLQKTQELQTVQNSSERPGANGDRAIPNEDRVSEQAKLFYRNQLDEEIQVLQAKLVGLRSETSASDDTADGVLKENTILRDTIATLENERQKHDGVTDRSSIEKITELQVNAANEVLELQAQIDEMRNQAKFSSSEELTIIRSEKAAADAEIEELRGQLESKAHGLTVIADENNSTKAELTRLQKEIDDLREQQTVSDSTNTELSAAKAEVQSLQQIRRQENTDREESIERISKERDTLQERLVTLEKQSEIKSKALNTEKTVTEETEAGLRKMLTEKSSLVNQLQAKLAVPNKDLAQEISQLKAKHESELMCAQQQAQFDLEEALKTEQDFLEQVRAELETDKSQVESSLTAKMELLQKQMLDQDTSHAHEIDSLKAEISSRKEDDVNRSRGGIVEDNSRDEELQATKQVVSDQLLKVQALQDQLELANSKFEREKKSIIDEHEKQTQALTTKVDTLSSQLQQGGMNDVSQEYIRQMHLKYEEDLDLLKSEHHGNLQSAESKLESMTSEKLRLEADVKQLRNDILASDQKHTTELQSLQTEAKRELEKELLSLEATIKDMESGDSELSRKVSDLQERTEADRSEYQRHLKQVEGEHAKEFDELLQQLDLVEAEHKNKSAKTDVTIKEKEAVIATLGKQVAETENRLHLATQTSESLTRDLGNAQEHMKQAQTETENTKQEIVKLASEHQHAMDEAKKLRDAAIEEAREEMIRRAEVEFESANATYKKLKVEFDAATSKIGQLEKKVKSSEDLLDKQRKRKDDVEVEHAETVAQLKAELAAADAKATSRMKQHRIETESFESEKKSLESKLDDALEDCKISKAQLADAETDKKRLDQECLDMKAVCEELMTIVEGPKESS